MITAFFARRTRRFREWWCAPTTRADRILGAIVGGLGGLVAGLLARLLLGQLPVSLAVVGWWALSGAVLGLVFGTIFPKAAACVFFPLSLFGVGGVT